VEITAVGQKSFPVPAAAGSAVLLTGFVLVVAGNRRLRPNRPATPI
jgi:hypothetical protein